MLPAATQGPLGCGAPQQISSAFPSQKLYLIFLAHCLFSVTSCFKSITSNFFALLLWDLQYSWDLFFNVKYVSGRKIIYMGHFFKRSFSKSLLNGHLSNIVGPASFKPLVCNWTSRDLNRKYHHKRRKSASNLVNKI